MRSNNYKSRLSLSGLTAAVFLLASGAVLAQQQINLTAAPTSAALPDGSSVPMWGYSCGTVVDGSTATCAAANPAASRLVAGRDHRADGRDSADQPDEQPIFTNGNTVPTSLTIVGQLGGGLGSVGPGCTGGTTCTPPPDHSAAQQLTWPSPDSTVTGTPPVQGPRIQSFSTEVAAGATTALTWNALRAGTYLLESGTHPSIQGPMGLYGMVVVTDTSTSPATAYPAITYGADIPLLLSEIDPVQNAAVATAVTLPGFSPTTVWSGLPGGCGNPATTNSGNCYPPAVNYTPLYYLINGVAFDKTHPATSVFATQPATGVTGNVLVRLVNAGLRMHVPSIVGSLTGATPVSGFSLIAEDGNPLPGVPRVQSEVFMAAGKTYDVMINTPAGGTALPVFDRELSLSGNATQRDAGMLAYIGVNGAGAPAASAFGAAAAVADTYNCVVSGHTLTVSDPAKGVLANDTNVYGARVVGTAPAGLDAAHGWDVYLHGKYGNRASRIAETEQPRGQPVRR